MRKILCGLIGLSIIGFNPRGHSSPSAVAQRKPPAQAKNVLFIIADDMNDRLGVYGHPEVKTPNIDRLAARGIRFTNAYTNYALCNPCRTSFLSGRYPEVTRIYGNNINPRTYLGNATMMQEYFHQNGYFTARVGKIAHETFADEFHWDLNEANGPRVRAGNQALSYDKAAYSSDSRLDEDNAELVSAAQQQPQQQPQPQEEGVGAGRRRANQNNREAGGESSPWRWEATDQADEDTGEGRMVRRISQILVEHKDKPFFVAAGFRKPHTPWIAPKKYFDMYPPEKIKLPRELGEPADDRKDVPEIAFTKPQDFNNISDAKRREAIAAYYATVSFVDAQLGVLIDTMDKLKLWDNTIVVFVSDHGYHLGEHGGLARKETLFQEATHVPLIVVAPGSAKNVISSRPVELIDFYPTLTEFCGLPKPTGIQGVSFVPLLNKPSGAPIMQATYSVVRRFARGEGKEEILGHSAHTERYRYTEWGEDDKTVELYDLQRDPKEYTNLANKSGYANTQNEMKRVLRDARRRTTMNLSATTSNVPQK